jgi:hypothetical protein
MRALTSFLPANLPRTRPIAAGVPRSVESAVTASPTQMLSQAESVQAERAKKLAYHCRLKPGGGKVRYLPEEKESGITTKIGNSK